MKETNVPLEILSQLAVSLESLTPEMRKAAKYTLDNPNDVGVSTVRELAKAASVKPNTLVRLAREVGFDGYEDFRAPFRLAIKEAGTNFQDRARWLQAVERDGDSGRLYAEIVKSALNDLENSFASISVAAIQDAAKAIWQSRRTYVLGVGVNYTNAQNFAYLASTGMEQFYAIPSSGETAIDSLSRANNQDVLIAMTHSPYRREVVEAVEIAKQQGVVVIGISDSLGSPIITAADHGFVLSVETPQFFTSSVSTIAFLETLLSFVIAGASDEIVDRVESFHHRRHSLGLYVDEPTQPAK
ncbi:MAG: MurR/RpiR family transcriptional regulator [Pseudomonadota bacterium]